ncbi:hypothetical protein AAFF_G00075940 [Aldrovandia affinis]|uniref:Uncharacterized protein n=1 Tax=Aldrovandia affinis TaxID=143900 RepID=A0AAD7RY01_9TELE|nr:hypothetical protein AAFF_G00075940 [Aldrovandia affinis]
MPTILPSGGDPRAASRPQTRALLRPRPPKCQEQRDATFHSAPGGHHGDAPGIAS